jgi:hypothetical protein
MNCKPGDLAYITRAFCPENVGLVVIVLDEGCPFRDYGWCWLTKSASPMANIRSDTGERADHSCYAPVPDAHLRPIRPQSDDARDESLVWLPPVPTTTKEHA